MERRKFKTANQTGSPTKRSRSLLKSSPENYIPSGDASVRAISNNVTALNNPNQYLKRFTRAEVAQQLLFDSSDEDGKSDAEEASVSEQSKSRNAKVLEKRTLPSDSELLRIAERRAPIKTRAQINAENRRKPPAINVKDSRRPRLSPKCADRSSETFLKRLTQSKAKLRDKAQEKTDVVYRRRYIVDQVSGAVKNATKPAKQPTEIKAKPRENVRSKKQSGNTLKSERDAVDSDGGADSYVNDAQQPEQCRRSPRRKQQQAASVRSTKANSDKNACDINQALLDLSLIENASVSGRDAEDNDDAALEDRLAVAGDTSGHVLGTDGGGDLLPLTEANKRTNKTKRGKNNRQAVSVRPNRGDVISRLAVARVEDYRNIEAGHDEIGDRAAWEDRSEEIFTELLNLLAQKSNVLVKGIGSKRNLLNRFAASSMMKDVRKIVVDGFDSSFSIVKLLQTIMEDVRMPDGHMKTCLRGIKSTSRIQDKVVDDAFARLGRCLKQQSSRVGDRRKDNKQLELFIILNNIDGPALRHVNHQRILARLSKLDNVRLIASYDFDDVGLLWPLDVLTLFGWIEYSCNTFEQYSYELQFDRGQQRRETDGRRLVALYAVFSSMTLNSKRVFLIIAKHQLQEDAEAEDGGSRIFGMPYDELRETCLAEMLSSSDAALRHQLSEYEDHRLMRIRRGLDGSEIIEILLPLDALKEFYAKQPNDMKVVF